MSKFITLARTAALPFAISTVFSIVTVAIVYHMTHKRDVEAYSFVNDPRPLVLPAVEVCPLQGKVVEIRDIPGSDTLAVAHISGRDDTGKELATVAIFAKEDDLEIGSMVNLCEIYLRNDLENRWAEVAVVHHE